MFKKLLNYYRRKCWSAVKYARFQGVKIGDNCNIQKVTFGSEPYLIEIGNHVQITNGTKIFTHGGGWVFRQEYPEFDCFGKVKIKDNVYIGNNSLIMPGVIIGNNVIVGAGSVVTKSIPNNKIVAGNPAKIISDIDTYKIRVQEYNINCKSLGFENKKNLILSLSEDKFLSKEILQ